MFNRHGKRPVKAHKKIYRVFFFMLTVFVLLTITNEIFDLPHYLFGDARTSFSQRKGEVVFELIIYFIVIFSSFWYFEKRMEKEIKILEGFIPICANCKKIRQDIDWKTVEEYISENSLAKFSHSICPDCLRLLYPEDADEILKKKREKA
jgi:hypothetical protein